MSDDQEVHPVIHRDRALPPLKPIKPWEGPKPTLEMKVTPTCRVKSRDLEHYIQKVFNIKGFDIAKATGARSDMAPEFLVTGVLSLANNIRQQVENIRRGRETHRLGLILDILCMDGFIQKGIYVIEIERRESPIEAYMRVLNETHDKDDQRCRELKRVHARDKEFRERVKIIDQKLSQLLEGRQR